MCVRDRDITAVEITPYLCRTPIPTSRSVSRRTAGVCRVPHTDPMLLQGRPWRPLRALLSLALLTTGCGGGDLELPSDTDGERLALIDGDGQQGRPGERLPADLVVRLLDGAGSGIADRAITWVASQGGGRLERASSTTDAEGFASARWILGPEVGTNTAEAVVSHVGAVTFTATAAEGEPSERTIEPIEGDDQTAPAGAAVPLRPAVRVLEGGDPVPGVQVTFTVTAGGGSVEGATQVTNAEGIARVGEWVLGTAPGSNRLEARGDGLSGSPVVFSAEGTGGSGVDRMVFVVQPPDEVDARERFRVEVALVDQSGDLVPLSGIVVYLGLFRDGNDVPSNSLLLGDRFRETQDGVAVFDDIGVTDRGRYRLRALTDDLPEHGPHGPQPALFSDQFDVD